MSEKKLVIIGASGQGKVIADIAVLSGKYQEIVFLDDDPAKKQCMGFEVIGTSASISDYVDSAIFFVAVGNPDIRKRFIEALEINKACIATLFHPSAVIGSNVQMGAGTVVMAGAVVNPDCCLGKACVINTGSSVDHDCVLGDYVHVSIGARLAGNVTVGNATWVGAGAIVNNNVRITDSCMIGSGAVVIKDVGRSGTYVGVPARPVRFREERTEV